MILFFTFILLFMLFFSGKNLSVNKLFLFFFCIYFVVPYLLIRDLGITLDTELFLISILMAFYLGYFSYPSYTKKKLIKFRNNRTALSPKNLRNLQSIFKFLAGICFVAIFMHLRSNGLSLNDYLGDFFSIAHSYVKLRYSGEMIVSVWTGLAFSISYALCFFGGFLVIQKRWSFIFILLSLAPSILMTLLFATKGIMLSAISLFIGGVIYSMMLTNKPLPRIDFTNISRLIPIGIVLCAVVFSAFFSKGIYNSAEADLVSLVLQRGISYFSTHLYAFNDWYSWYLGGNSILEYTSHNFPAGSRTFWPVSDFIYGLSSQGFRPGYLDEIYFDNGQKTNLFTVFRGLIEDFGFFGCFLFISFIGLLARLVDLYSKNSPFSCLVIYLCLLWFFSNMFAISAFSWSSTYINVFVITFILFSLRVRLR